MSFCIAPNHRIPPAMIYRIGNSTLEMETIHVDKNQSIYPNGTIIRYGCSREEEASAIECQNGQWKALLLSCIDDNDDNKKRENNSAIIRQRAVNIGACPIPSIDTESYKVFNIDGWESLNKTTTIFPHSTNIMLKCAHNAFEKDKFEEWRCRMGKWHIRNKIECNKWEGGSCEFKFKKESKVNVFDSQTQDFVAFNQKFPNGARLFFTCSIHFMGQLRGNSEITCIDGEWSLTPPHCIPLLPEQTNQEGTLPPIHFKVRNWQFLSQKLAFFSKIANEFKVENGPFVVSPIDGALVHEWIYNKVKALFYYFCFTLGCRSFSNRIFVLYSYKNKGPTKVKK